MGKLKTMEATRVLDVVQENQRMKSIYLDSPISASPGQFVMVWIPGMDEKPFSLSYCDGSKIGITVAAVGPFSKRLHEVKAGEMLWIRGPFGNGFRLEGENVAVIGGGCGVAPLAFLAEELVKNGRKVFFINGAKTKDELLFVERVRKAGVEPIICTDDGSEGRKGFATDTFAELLAREKVDCAYTCGPEIMMKKVVDLCLQNKIGCQASLERFMKCGFGVCGQCAVDGLLVCKDGPVFPISKLSKLKEFGSVRRNACGAEERI